MAPDPQTPAGGDARPDRTAPPPDEAFARPRDGVGGFDPPARAEPAPTRAPAPSPAQQAAFGRPAAVQGGFAGDRPVVPSRPLPPPPPEAVLRAFAPPGPGQRGLQEPPGGRPGRRRTATGPWWKPDARSDPWRDPHAPAGLTGPAVFAEPEQQQTGPVVLDAKGRRRLRRAGESIRLTGLPRLAVLLTGPV